ncbi:hypothetical protein ABMA28_013053 [Loxostege sticticalis]|uniref:Uncharacterized protein n=1 Tax=Loxostege sticticalis TaxID=481309 RepID=A0ABD0S3N6_LOXSC
MSVINNKKGPIYDPGTCRCCGASKKCRILNVEYEYQDQKEIYSDLFVECFGLVLFHLDGEPIDRLICATCVSRLREACSFRRQVLQCEEKLLQSRIHVHEEGTCGPPPMVIKTEVTIKEENEDEDHMDYCEDSTNDIGVNENVSANPVATDKTEPSAKRSPTKDDLARRQLLLKIQKMKERLKRVQRAKKPPTPQYRPLPVHDKFVDEESLIYENTVTIVENSYVCPFQTSYSTYFCVYCKSTFSDPIKLRDHNSKHDPKRFKYVFNNKKSTHIDIERIDCRLCDQNITDMDTLKSHLKEHGKKLNNVKEEFLKFRLKNGTISCTECDKSFVFFHALKRHMAEHFGSFVCDICGAHYFDRRTLDMHTKNSHKSEESRYSCHECGKLLKNKHSMFLHVSSVHKKEAAFQCSKCDEVFFSYKDRYRHMLDVHREAKIYPCDSCGKVYTNTKNLREHNRTVHLKIFKHRCGICDRGFAQPSRLNEHVMSMHRNERSFYCDMCGKSYPRLHYLKLHIQSHNSQET